MTCVAALVHDGRVFDAIGCGRPYALGALAVTGGDPVRRVERAVRVAERFNAGVRGPVRSWVLE